MYFILWLIFVILWIVHIIFRDKERKERHQVLQKLYPEIKKKWEEKALENLGRAMDVYPSKQFLGKDEERWQEMIDKQREYTQKQDNLCVQQLQKEYNLTEEEWRKLVSK